jgi:hypothetical protein
MANPAVCIGRRPSDGSVGYHFVGFASKVVWSHPRRVHTLTGKDALADLARPQASRGTLMAAIAVAQSASGREDGANHAVEMQAEPQQPDLSARTEVDIVARALCAVSLHGSLTDALLGFYSSLNPAEARERTALVLDRMRKILPDDLASDLPEACYYEKPWSERSESKEAKERSVVYRLALPAVYLIGALMLVLSVVGSITTVHYLISR